MTYSIMEALIHSGVDELDRVLKQKLDELKACAIDEKVAEEKLADSKRKLEWLEDIQARVNAILDI